MHAGTATGGGSTTQQLAEPSAATLQRAAYGALASAVVLGAVAPTILRSASSPGILFAAWRMVVGVAVCAGVMALRGKRLTVRILRDAALGGVCFGLFIGLFYASVARTSVTNAVVISSLRPAIVVAVVGPVLKERVRPATLVWTAVAVAGAAFAVVADSRGVGGDASLAGDLLAVGGVVAGTGYLLATKRGRRNHDAMTFTTGMMVTGAAVLFPLAAVTGDGIGLPATSDWKWLVVMALLPGFGHVANNHAVAHLPLSVVSNASLLTPGIAAALAWVLVDERILASDVVGMALTAGALAMVVWTAPPVTAAAAVPSNVPGETIP